MDAATRLLEAELRATRSLSQSGDTAQVLKWLAERGVAEELVQREYGGRYVFELLQNANDAAGGKGITETKHRVAIVITESSLIVANEGASFQDENVESICTLGQSSKDPRKSLGYKGLGFKSVGELTDRPQIISPPHQFGFSIDRARQELSKLVGPLPPGQRFPMYAFPFPLPPSSLGQDHERITALLSDKFVSIIRLPYRSGMRWEAVLDHVQSVVTPEMLLFLDATTEIEVSWPGGCTRVFKRERETHDRCVIVDVGQDDIPCQQWLVFRSRAIPLPNLGLVEGLDHSWHRVRRVAASLAFPMLDSRLAVEQAARPVSVYFPSETHTGHTFLFNADFYLDLDRRHISDTPQAYPYNNWLAERVAMFFARDVLPELPRMYPADYRVVHACAQAGSESGFGEVIARHIRDLLKRTRFIPASGGPVTPRMALRSPVPRDSCSSFHHFFVREALGAARHNLVHVDVENDERADQLIRSLGAQTVPDDAILRSLARQPDVLPHELADFYTLLGRWRLYQESVNRGATRWSELQRCPLLHTSDGRWVAAAVPAFFPPVRGFTDIPAGFPGNILHPACTTGHPDAERLLTNLGVQPFRWREVILTSLLPTLEGDPTDSQIEAAHQFLRAYFREERGTDEQVTSRIGMVPVRARRANRRTWSWQPAGNVYFSREWLGASDLEDLYGAMGRQEFLAQPLPEEQPARDQERAFLAWLGVADRPRLYPFVIRIQPGWTEGRPTSADTARWRAYVEYLAEPASDPQGHPNSQQLRTSVLDRLDDLLTLPSAKQAQALLKLLVTHSTSYEAGYNGEIRCTNAQHRGERSRPVRTYLWFVLRNTTWVPARIGGVMQLLPPDRVWLVEEGMPKRLGQLLPRVSIENYSLEIKHMALALGFVDPPNAEPEDYIGLLRLLPEELPLPGPPAFRSARRRQRYEEQTADLARWAMRNLNVSLSEGAEVSESQLAYWRKIPLLAMTQHQLRFVAQPVLPDDARLARKLDDRFSWFEGDRGWTKFAQAFGLRRITSLASIDPIPGDAIDQASRDLAKRLEDAKPFILALVNDEAPSEVGQAKGRLGRLTTSVVKSLTLRVRVQDAVAEERFITEEAYLKQTQTQSATGPIRHAVGIYYCVESADQNFYLLGSAIADFLDRPSLGDAFSIVLRSGRDERLRFLSSKSLGIAHVRDMRRLLGQSDDEDDEIVHIPASPDRSKPDIASSLDDQKPRHIRDGGSSAGTQRSQRVADGRVLAELPPIDSTRLKVVDAYGGTQRRDKTTRHEHNQGESRTSSSRHPNWEAMDAMRRLYGQRGEAAVYAAEQRRLEAAGISADLVRWVSQDDEIADHDLESVDEDGGIIFIEVKSTSAANLWEPFPITSAELRCAARQRSRYFIYRVTEVDEVVPIITRFRDPIGLWELGVVDAEMMQARMWLPHPDPSGS